MIILLNPPQSIPNQSVGLSGTSAVGSTVGGGPVSTNGVAVSVSGGNAPYSYQWLYVSGDASVTCNSPTALLTSWSASGTAPQNKNAIWKCVVTDTRGVSVDSPQVSVSLSFNINTLAVSLNSPTASGSGNGSGPFSTNTVTATPSGGNPGYSYQWNYISGDASITVSSATSQTVSWSASGTAPQTKSATWNCTATDSGGNSATSGSVSVSVTFSVASLSVSATPTSVYGLVYGSGVGYTDDPSVATASGGTPPYSYAWSRIGGATNCFPESYSSASSRFGAGGSYVNTYVANFVCTVTDAASNVAVSNQVTAIIDFVNPN